MHSVLVGFLLDSVSLTKMILGNATAVMGGIMNVGKGIGSVFILFVIFYYVSAILDGGKFQTKMLFPLLVYFAVCNFKFVSVPVVNFATTIQNACVSVCEGRKAGMLRDIAGGSETNNIFQAFMANAKNQEQQTAEQERLEKEMASYDEAVLEIDEGDADISEAEADAKVRNKSVKGGSKSWFKNLGSNIGNALKKVWMWQNEMIMKFFFLFIPGSYDENKEANYQLMAWGVPGAIALILQWVTVAVSFAMKGLAAILIAIVVAFGPVTWAFAIFPGNQRVLASWAIRIVQFSLYAPIIALIDTFSVSILYSAASVAGAHGAAGSLLQLLGILICNLVALTSTPTIASMIIEGASGSVSLTGGMQMISGAVTTSAAMMTALPRGGFNLAAKLKSYQADKVMAGEGRRDQQASGQNTGPKG